ncbi:MAG: hypothetical protein ACD_10C00081G0001, partial [uncultured bacterium]
MSKHPSFYLAFLLGLFLQAGLPLSAAVNDIFPGDYFPQKPGKTTVALYAYDRNSGGPYADGHKLLDGAVDMSILALRVNRAFRVGDTIVTPVMVLPWTRIDVEPAPLA